MTTGKQLTVREKEIKRAKKDSGKAHVIHVGNIHDELNVEVEVVLHDTSDDVSRDIVARMANWQVGLAKQLRKQATRGARKGKSKQTTYGGHRHRRSVRTCTMTRPFPTGQ